MNKPTQRARCYSRAPPSACKNRSFRESIEHKKQTLAFEQPTFYQENSP
jgi:hypothetical protein